MTLKPWIERAPLLLAGLFLFALPACDDSSEPVDEGGADGDGDTGTPNGPGDGLGEGYVCAEQSRTPLTLDATSPGGFSADEILALVGAEHGSTLQFLSDGFLSEDLKGSSDAMRLGLEVRGIMAEYIDVELEGDGSGDLPGVECPDRLEIPVTLTFETEGGLFAESAETTLVATEAGRATISMRMDPGSIDGSFDGAAAFPDVNLNYLEITGEFSAESTGGSLLAEIESGSGDDGFVGFGVIALWGDAEGGL